MSKKELNVGDTFNVKNIATGETTVCKVDEKKVDQGYKIIVSQSVVN